MAMTLDNCCFCADLRLGSLIIGYFHLIKNIIQILISMILLAICVTNRSRFYYHEAMIASSATFLTFGIITLIFTILLLNGLNQMKDLIQILISTIILAVFVPNRYYYRYVLEIGFSAAFLTFGLITLIFTILLLNGLNQYKPAFVLAFLIHSGISTVIYSIIGLVFICISEIFILFVPGLLFLALYVYFIMVIRSYYPKIDNTGKSAIFSTPAGPFVQSSNYIQPQV